MSVDWLHITSSIEPLQDCAWDNSLIQRLQAAHVPTPIRLHTPTFKHYESSELPRPRCGKSIWPAISITGSDCKLNCDHCQAKILEPMLAARTPQALWHMVQEQIALGARGMLLSGGSNVRNEVEYQPFYPVLRKTKDHYPDFQIAVHTALMDADNVRCLEQAGVDVAMMDVIGAQDTITQVYHLKRRVDDFERTLENLVSTRMRVVPHIVIGLHYGRLLGEWRALEIVQRHRPSALVLVVAMPQYAPVTRPFLTPDAHAVGRFFLEARDTLRDMPLLLGCARPAGQSKTLIDAYAVMAGLQGVAHPAEGVVALAQAIRRPVQLSSSCCSIALEEALFALENEAGTNHPTCTNTASLRSIAIAVH